MSIDIAKIGVAVAGLGIGEQHVRAYMATGKCELRWLYDLDREKALRLTREFNAGMVADTFDQIVGDPHTRAVSIASFDDAHYDQVVAALNAGKHVFVEKPLCRSIDELRTVKQAWLKHEGRLKLSSNLVLRAAPLYQWLKQQIRLGVLGDIYSIDGDYLYGRLDKVTHGWRKDVPNYSVTFGGGIHLIDLMLWLTGRRPSSVSAVGNQVCTEGSEFHYNDFVAATFQYATGLVGRITANFGSVHAHQHVLRVFGTKATFIYDDSGARLHVSRDPCVRPTPVKLAPLPETKGELIGPFVSSIFDDDNPDQGTQEIFDVISICAATDKALRANSSMEINYA
jgi:predicted dehydrogenase